MTFTGKKFPSIAVNAINAKGESKEINVLELAVQNKKKVCLFWYPKDFTFVCPTELHAFQAALGEFEKRNTIVIGASCDSNEVHFAWLCTPKKQGGIEGVTYDILSDTNRNLSSILGILDASELEYNEEFGVEMKVGDDVTYRATYLIDEEGTVFHEGVNAMPLGRNVNEFLRLIDAWQHNQQHGEVCPANWNEGATAMKADRNAVAEYLSLN
jgi:peroxiredoxin (alkyl hydroperoxide reductase subunit C)